MFVNTKKKKLHLCSKQMFFTYMKKNTKFNICKYINHYDDRNIKVKKFYMDSYLRTLSNQFWRRIYRKDIKNGKYFITIDNYHTKRNN